MTLKNEIFTTIIIIYILLKLENPNTKHKYIIHLNNRTQAIYIKKLYAYRYDNIYKQYETKYDTLDNF